MQSYLVGRRGDRFTQAEEIPFASLDGLPFILPSAPNGLRTALDALARQHRITLEPVIEADSLPLMRSVVAEEGLYTVLPLHAVWSDVEEGKLQASRIVSPAVQRIVSMTLARTKGPGKAISAVTALIEQAVAEEASRGLWQLGGPE